MNAVLVRLEHGVLTGLADLVVHFLLGLLHHFLNAGGVNAAVHNQLLHGDAGDLAAHRVEGGDDDRLGRVVDDQVNAGGRLQGADVAALAADDAALHVVVGQRDHAHRGLSHMVGGALLNGQGDNVAGLLLALLLGAGFNVAHHGGSVVEGVLLHPLDNDLLGLVLGHAGDALQLLHLTAVHGLGFLLELLDFRLLPVQTVLPGFHVVGLLVQGFLPLEQTALGALNLVAALAQLALVLSLFPVVLRLGPEDFFLGFQNLFLLVLVRLAHGVVIQMPGIFLGAADLLLGDVPAIGVTAGAARAAAQQQRQQNPDDGRHGFPSLSVEILVSSIHDPAKSRAETLLRTAVRCFSDGSLSRPFAGGQRSLRTAQKPHWRQGAPHPLPDAQNSPHACHSYGQTTTMHGTACEN